MSLNVTLVSCVPRLIYFHIQAIFYHFTDGTLLDVHISKIVTGKVYFPMDQPVEEDKNYSLSQCILQCRSKSATCKMVIYDSSISDCGLISKFYDEKSLADCTEQVRSLRSDILAYQIWSTRIGNNSSLFNLRLL